MPDSRRWSDADRELVERAWRSTSAVRLHGIEMMISDAMRAADVLDALTAAGWVRMDPAEPHLIEFRADGWTIQHPVRCRPNLFACMVNRVAGEQIDVPPEPGLGVYECSLDDGELVIGRRIEEGAEDDDEWAITALTDTGVAYLDSSAGGGCDWEPPERFAILIDPGDMITWSTEGDDSHLCIDELQVLRKAAARLEPDAVSRVFSRWRNPAPKPTTVPPGSPGFWEDSERFWRESAAFWDKQARISRDLMWLWIVVAALLVTSAVLAVLGG